MTDSVRFPFIETSFSLSDLKKLEEIGALKTIFIELLKMEKIKNKQCLEKFNRFKKHSRE